jgi:hypothetical protein
MAKIKPKQDVTYRWQGDGFVPVDSFGEMPPTANMDEIIVAVGDEQMEASGGDCPIITFFAAKSKLAAVVHVDAEHAADDYHETMIDALLSTFSFPKNSHVHISMDLSGQGKEPKERKKWFKAIKEYLVACGYAEVSHDTEGEGKYVTLDAKNGRLSVELEMGGTVKHEYPK